MKILVIGGSYFLGRVFVMLAQEQHEVTVVNRGSQPLAGMKVREIRWDRHDADVWKQLEGDYDALVDFCAYRPGDIRTVAENLAGSVKQYIFISTVDVYAHGEQKVSGSGEQEGSDSGDGVAHGRIAIRTEDFPFETRQFPGEAGDYIAGKVALERELREVCAFKGIQATALRPAFIYGPMNYAPRETVFIQMMARDGILPVITGADGKFQFLYVKDGAEAILKCLLNEAAYGQAYNLCGDEIADYGMLADVLGKVGEELMQQETSGMRGGERGSSGAQGEWQGCREEKLQRVEISVQQAESQGFPLPFPVPEAESHLCSNEKSKRELGMVYTSLEEGMRKTCRAFWDILRQ